MSKISIVALALISTTCFAQKTTANHIKDFNSDTRISRFQPKIVAKPLVISDSLHVITLNNVQLKQLSELFQTAQQLIARSPDMSAYQASETQKSLSNLALIISKQLSSKTDTLKK